MTPAHAKQNAVAVMSFISAVGRALGPVMGSAVSQHYGIFVIVVAAAQLLLVAVSFPVGNDGSLASMKVLLSQRTCQLSI